MAFEEYAEWQSSRGFALTRVVAKHQRLCLRHLLQCRVRNNEGCMSGKSRSRVHEFGHCYTTRLLDECIGDIERYLMVALNT